MQGNRLQEDLLQEFSEQKEHIYQQLAIFDPLGTQLRKPAAKRLVSKGALIVAEIFCYLLAAGTVATTFFLNKIHPFYILSDLSAKPEYQALGSSNISFFKVCVYVMIGSIALLLFIIARCVRTIRLKNDILNFAGKQINTLVSQHLKRRAVIETIEQRHRGLLPVMPYTKVSDYEGVRVNDVPNPGYGD